MKVQRLLLTLIITALLLVTMVPAVSAATQTEIDTAISNGVVWLATHQNAGGSWGSYFPTGETGLAVLKLEDRAIELGMSPFDPAYAYKSNVENGLQYLFDNVQADGSINAEGYEHVYTTSIALMAICESGAPNKMVTSANPNSNGKTYKQIAQKAVDWLLAAQGPQGGFGYELSSPGWEDQSNAGWATLGLVYAQKFGISDAAALPKLANWVTVIQNPVSGGCDYTPGYGWVNVYKTGSLLYQFKMVGRGTGDPAVVNALTYLNAHWNDPNQDPGWYGSGAVPHYQGMFSLMKGFEAQGITTFGSGPINWYDDFADRIVDTQNADGSWPTDYWGSGQVLSTSWALLTLERTTETPPASFDVKKSADTTSVAPGGSVTYTYLVSNTGNVPISSVVLTDDTLGVISGPASGDTSNPGFLDPFETWTYTTTTTLLVTTTNTATAAGMDPTGAPVSVTSDPVTVSVTGVPPHPAPEFPSLAIPAGMILGIAFVVYSIRMTKKD